jgi:hypothetical protein
MDERLMQAQHLSLLLSLSDFIMLIMDCEMAWRHIYAYIYLTNPSFHLGFLLIFINFTCSVPVIVLIHKSNFIVTVLTKLIFVIPPFSLITAN